MKAKFSQNHFLEPSWGLLGAFWAHLKKLHPLEANLGVKIDKKIEKINVKKRLVLRDVLFSKFLEFSMDLRAPKPGILNQFLQ